MVGLVVEYSISGSYSSRIWLMFASTQAPRTTTWRTNLP